MSLSRVNPAGWGTNNKLTSSQANAMDLNATYAVDKRSGQTDTLSSQVSVNGGLAFTSSALVTYDGATSVEFSPPVYVWRAVTTPIVAAPAVLSGFPLAQVPLGGRAYQILRVSQGSILMAVKATVYSTCTSLPTTKMELQLCALDVTGATGITVLQSVYDPSPSLAAYQTAHQILLVAGNTIDNTSWLYYLYLTPETGGGAAADVWECSLINVAVGSIDLTGM